MQASRWRPAATPKSLFSSTFSPFEREGGLSVPDLVN
jgi:hypothetical protein